MRSAPRDWARANRPRRLRLPPESAGDAATGNPANRTTLAGSLLERGTLRYSPAGVPVIEFRIAHASEQIEAGQVRRAECEIACVALGTIAQLLKDTAPGSGLTVSGFLAARSLKRHTPVLHVTTVEFTEQF